MRTASGNLGEGAGREVLHSDDSAESVEDQFFTSNPRHLRVLIGLLRRALPREHVDTTAGASNGPELIAEFRRRGLQVPCDRIPVYDRDGREVKRGVYHLTNADRRKIHRFFAERRKRDAR
jgi:hypothetical protein